MATVILGILYLALGAIAIMAGLIVAAFALSGVGMVAWLGVGVIWLLSAPVLMLSGLARNQTCSEWMAPWCGVLSALWGIFALSGSYICYAIFGIFLLFLALCALNQNGQNKEHTA
jgi:hypothetical protein